MIKEKGDDKYAKASKQKRSDLLAVMLVIVVMSLLGLGYYWNQNKQLRSNYLHEVPGAKEISSVSIGELEHKVEMLDRKVREIKANVDIFETDPEAQAAATTLQEATRHLLAARYGSKEPYHVKVILQFQPSIPDFQEKGASGEFMIEMAPSSIIPHSVFTFLEVARNWKSGAFHRIAPHVLQVMVQTNNHIQHLAFQEYSPLYPHEKMTCGYAGRPSGPAFYVSIQDNSKNHGPGSQQEHNPYEADASFGKVIEGFEETVMRITKVPGKSFLNDPALHVIIKQMIIMIPNESGEYQVWSENDK